MCCRLTEMAAYEKQLLPSTRACQWIWLNSLPNDKILDETKLKAFADDKINVAQMMVFVFDRVENIVENGEMLVTSILSFSHNVLKSSFLGSLKVGTLW